MKFACTCGNTIRDQTDYLPYKAHFISDQDGFDVSDAICQIVSDAAAGRMTVENAQTAVCRTHIAALRLMYQCNSCGRLWIQSHDKQELRGFAAEQPAPQLLSSIHGSRWKRVLRGSWTDEPRFSTLMTGPACGILETRWSEAESATFDDWESLKRAYYSRFENLKRQGALRDALLTRNGETIHSWDSKDGTRGKG
jgi:hypothetical protein